MLSRLSFSSALGGVISALNEAWRRTTAAAAASSERLRTTLTSIGDAVIATDAAGRITLMNPVAEALTGWRDTEAVGRRLAKIFVIVNEESRRTVDNPVEKVLREGAVTGLANHTLLLSKDGREIPIDDSAAPIHTDDGRIVGAVVVFREITERRRHEQTLGRLAAIVEASADAILTKTLDGTITSWNPGAEQMFGYSAAEAVGRPVTMLFPPDRIAEEAEFIRRIATGERVEHFETERIRKDGQRIQVSVSLSPVKNAAGSMSVSRQSRATSPSMPGCLRQSASRAPRPTRPAGAKISFWRCFRTSSGNRSTRRSDGSRCFRPSASTHRSRSVRSTLSSEAPWRRLASSMICWTSRVLKPANLCSSAAPYVSVRSLPKLWSRSNRKHERSR
jgi:PAS domain S-box-containing protein